MIDLTELAGQRTEARRIIRAFLDRYNLAPQEFVILGEPSKRFEDALRLVLSLSLGSDAETHQIMLTAMIQASEAMERINELIEGYVDVKDGDYGVPVANDAMRAKQEIDSLIPRLDAAILRGQGR
jgi:hypothetical protein